MIESDMLEDFFKFVIFCALICFVCALIFYPDVFADIESTLKSFTRFSDVPLTNHAQQSHIEQSWNAVTIAEYFDAGNCSPNSCDVGDTKLVFCDYDEKPGYSLMLVIGKTVEQVITGYIIETDRLMQKCR